MAVEAFPLVGRYREAELIGVGGIGGVYRATDSLLGRLVALKVMGRGLAADVDVRRRFMREALAAARLSAFPHVVTVYDVGECDGQAYMVMEYLPGGSLEERLQREGAQRPSRVLEWLEQAGTALDAAHGKGIVHGGLKPANLLLDAGGEVRVADFGTSGAALLGSVTQTAAGDRYALAVAGFELLTGRLPFAAEILTAGARTNGPVISICAANPALPCELDAVFAIALAPDPRQRYGSCAELVAALRTAFADAAAPTGIGSLPPTTAPVAATAPAPSAFTRHRGRSRLLWPVAGLLALAALGAAIAAVLSSGRTHAGQAQRTSNNPPPRLDRRAQATTDAGITAAPAADPHLLNDNGFALMNRGDYRAALPLLEGAVRDLRGHTDDPYDGYANFNLGLDLIKLGRCADALPYLNTAKRIEPRRPEVDNALEVAGRCVSGGS